MENDLINKKIEILVKEIAELKAWRDIDAKHYIRKASYQYEDELLDKLRQIEDK